VDALVRTVYAVVSIVVLIIDSRLHALGLPPPRVTHAATLQRSPVSFLRGSPETEGSPNTQADSPAAHYPGNAYVDWVGTDFYIHAACRDV
jgi:hypothetical protein